MRSLHSWLCHSESVLSDDHNVTFPLGLELRELFLSQVLKAIVYIEMSNLRTTKLRNSHASLLTCDLRDWSMIPKGSHSDQGLWVKLCGHLALEYSSFPLPLRAFPSCRYPQKAASIIQGSHFWCLWSNISSLTQPQFFLTCQVAFIWLQTGKYKEPGEVINSPW